MTTCPKTTCTQFNRIEENFAKTRFINIRSRILTGNRNVNTTFQLINNHFVLIDIYSQELDVLAAEGTPSWPALESTTLNLLNQYLNLVVNMEGLYNALTDVIDGLEDYRLYGDIYNNLPCRGSDDIITDCFDNALLAKDTADNIYPQIINMIETINSIIITLRAIKSDIILKNQTQLVIDVGTYDKSYETLKAQKVTLDNLYSAYRIEIEDYISCISKDEELPLYVNITCNQKCCVKPTPVICKTIIFKDDKKFTTK